MCGIAGIRQFVGVPEQAALEAMIGTLGHRGPDDSGSWFGPGIALGHARLSIIDLGGSHQPMHGTDGRWVLSFNGEIFNYRDLRQILDYPFVTDGDTEVILAGLTIHGITFVDELVGQFAFAALDTLTGTVHLVRDRLGVLPLYYSLSDERLVFGSEVKTVLAGLGSRPSVDLLSLDAYLSARSVAAPDTLFDGIKKLPAAHRAEVDAVGGIRLQRYWSPPEADPSTSWTAVAAVDAVDAGVTEAVTSALVADVPVGAYLSGGVDSSLIAAMIMRVAPGQHLHTFAAGFGDPRNDELPWARRVSDHVGTDHHEVRVDATDLEELWPTLTWHRDAPMSEPADIAVYRLAQAAREHVSVILSGEGGDELFAGYPKYKVAQSMAGLARVPAPVRSAISRGIETRLPQRFEKARIALRVLGERSTDDQFRAWFSPFTTFERSALLAGAPRRDAVASGAVSSDVIRGMLLNDLRSWLPDNLLERGDRMSMAASLELRPPLLDHRLVELAFRLPSEYKVRDGRTKWVLKEVARRYLPHDVVDRRKVGFRVPLDTWFRTSLRDSVRDRLTGTSSFVGQTFDRRSVEALLTRHESGTFNEESRIWTLMSLEVWHETFFGAHAPAFRPGHAGGS